MIPFEQAWPYESMKDDLYVSECPFCHAPNVFIPLKKSDLSSIREGKKKLLVFPCCYQHVTLLDADHDYLLTNRVLRGRASN